MSRKKIILVLSGIILLLAQGLWAKEVLVLSGINRIQRPSEGHDRFVLMETRKQTIQDGDILKTKGKGYLLIEENGFRLMIYPFSRVIIRNLASKQFEVSYGKILLETDSAVLHSVTFGNHRASLLTGAATLQYSEKTDTANDFLQASVIRGTLNLSVNGQGFRLSTYQRMIKDREQKIQTRFAELTELPELASDYQSYQSKISGWETSEREKNEFLFKPGGKLAFLSFQEKSYFLAGLKTQFKYGQWQWGLFLPFYVDYQRSDPYRPKTWGNYEEWSFSSFQDTLSDLALKIDYVTYGTKYETAFYIDAGNLDKAGIANPLMMSSFKPNLNYPQRRQLTVESAISSNSWGIEAFAADFSSLEIFGMRGFYKPFSSHYLFKKLEIGVSAVADLDPEDQNQGTGKTSLYAYGFDLNLPVYNFSEIATFNLTSQFSDTLVTRNGKMESAAGFGYSYGISGNFFDLIRYQGGGLILKDEYPDSYFDAFYLLQRAEKLRNLLGSRSKNRYGFYGSLAIDFDQVLKIDLSYREVLRYELVDSRPQNKFSFSLYVYPALMDFAYLVFTYDRLGIESFSQFWNQLFSSELSAVNASLRLPFKLRFLELQLNFRRSVQVENQRIQTENSYESQIKVSY